AGGPGVAAGSPDRAATGAAFGRRCGTVSRPCRNGGDLRSARVARSGDRATTRGLLTAARVARSGDRATTRCHNEEPAASAREQPRPALTLRALRKSPVPTPERVCARQAQPARPAAERWRWEAQRVARGV